MKTPIAISSVFAVIIGLYGITPVMAESCDDRGSDREDRASASQAPDVYPSEGPRAELPAAQTENGTTFVTGGVGKPEAAAMKAVAGRYDLMLVFADRSGHYLADVDVKIKNKEGNTVLDTVSDPILLVDLPSGRYTVQANANGELLVRTFSLTGKTDRQSIQFVYRSPANRGGDA